MSTETAASLVEPLVRQGLFESSESAITELAESYVLQNIQRYQEIVANLEDKHGMTYREFNRYLLQRTILLESGDLPQEQVHSLGKAIMEEEEDALEWKIAREMLQSWLGLREVTA